MYICVCRAVTDTQIRECVSRGACSLREVQQYLGVASQCGKCAPCAQQLIGAVIDLAGAGAAAAQR